MPRSETGCFTVMLRRMLCTGNVPTHPSSSSSSDQITEINGQDHHAITKQQSGPTLVAKLMGLDSLPPSKEFALKSSTPDSLSRSRSVNFADYLSKLDITESHRHRRVRTSVSFREVPTPTKTTTSSFRRNDAAEPKQTTKREKGTRNDDGKETNDKKINEQRRRVLPKDSKKNPERKNGVLGSVLPRERKCSRRNGYGSEKLKVSKRENGKKATEKFVRKRKSQNGNKKIRPIEINQENLSPVSVLEDTLFSERPSRAVKHLDLRIELEPKIEYHIEDEFELRSSYEKINNEKNRHNKYALFDYTELAEKLLNLTKNDLSESYWIINPKSVKDCQGFEDICMEFEALILDVLLQENKNESTGQERTKCE